MKSGILIFLGKCRTATRLAASWLARRREQRREENFGQLRRSCPVVLPQDEPRTISVEITVYNGARMAHLALINILNDPRISEIVVLDGGGRTGNFRILRRRLRPFLAKVKLFRRDENWGAFANKIQAVELCKSDRVVLLDYDNTLLPEYLDALFSVEAWDQRTIYCSAYAFPNFDFREELGGLTIGLDEASSMARRKALNGPFFNDGNYMLPRNEFLECMRAHRDRSVGTADSIFLNYLRLSAGNRLVIQEDSRYVHRVLEGSYWPNHGAASMKSVEKLVHWFEEQIGPDPGKLDAEFPRKPIRWSRPVQHLQG